MCGACGMGLDSPDDDYNTVDITAYREFHSPPVYEGPLEFEKLPLARILANVNEISQIVAAHSAEVYLPVATLEDFRSVVEALGDCPVTLLTGDRVEIVIGAGRLVIYCTP